MQKPQNGYGDGQKPKRALFPQSHGASARSECHKLPPELNKSAPILERDPRRWNHAAGPISATICSVLEAGWKPSTPGFWQTPDASATLDGALFNKAQIIDSFSRNMKNAIMEMSGWHSLSAGMEKGINTDFAKKARSQLIKEGNFMAARALDFLVCEVISEPRFFFLSPGSMKLWECLGNLVTLAQEFWDTDQVLFARGRLSRGWLPASELAECSEVRIWGSSGSNECANNNLLVASDGSRVSRRTPKSVTQVAFGMATFSLQPLSDTSFKLLRIGFLGGQVPDRLKVPRTEMWGAIQILSGSTEEVEYLNSDLMRNM